MTRITLDLDTEADAQLRELTRQRGQDESRIVSEALALLTSLDLDLEEDVRRLRGFEGTQRGVPLEDVKTWVRSWGTANELPPPEPRKV